MTQPVEQITPPSREMDALIALYNQDKLTDVVRLAAALIAQYPSAFILYNISGAASIGLKRLDEAVVSFERALAIEPNSGEAHNNLGIALYGLGRLDEAIASYRRALAINNANAPAHIHLGVAYKDCGQLEEAMACFMRASSLQPDNVETLNSLADVLWAQGRLDEAFAVIRRALALQPNYAEAYNTLGNILQGLRRPDEAMSSYQRALANMPHYAKAHNNLGALMQREGRLDEALVNYRSALAIDPDFAEAHANLGTALQELGMFDAAAASLKRAVEIKPGYHMALSQLLILQATMCDWGAMEPYGAVIPRIGLEGDPVPPFTMLVLEDAPERHLLRAAAYARQKLPQVSQWLPAAHTKKSACLKIGYFSGDFRGHATMCLMAGLFERHNRTQFEIQAFAFGPESHDDMRQRAARAFDRFHDVRGLGDEQVAMLARAEGIDIAVDLTGYAQHTRAGIFAFRAAPVQIGYLGYPGSLGAPLLDYIIADGVIIPEGQEENFSEKIIRLPHSYQANDNSRVISERNFTRREAGLPEKGFVFCCFNNNYKIGPAEFDIWMRLLREIKGSVLWLLKTNDASLANLQRQATLRGVDAQRLVFAEQAPPADHLARHRCADLFLDTFNYNAHTTGSDALWAGLPLITKLGRGFPARVAASLLNAVGMPELVTTSDEEYFQLARALAENPAKRAAIKEKLARNRLVEPLFDTGMFARHLEQAYRQAFERHSNGFPPDHIYVAG